MCVYHQKDVKKSCLTHIAIVDEARFGEGGVMPFQLGIGLHWFVFDLIIMFFVVLPVFYFTLFSIRLLVYYFFPTALVYPPCR